jgi:hypothetical protein
VGGAAKDCNDNNVCTNDSCQGGTCSNDNNFSCGDSVCNSGCGESVSNCSADCADPDSCVGNCGGPATGGCYCDSYCSQAGDCCDDACSVCGYCGGDCWNDPHCEDWY